MLHPSTALVYFVSLENSAPVMAHPQRNHALIVTQDPTWTEEEVLGAISALKANMLLIKKM